MNIPAQIAAQIRAVYFGGNWTSVNLRQTIDGVSYQQAITKIHSFNTIAALLYHINYYVVAVTKVLEGRALDASDKFSFNLPPIQSEEAWKAFVQEVLQAGSYFASLVEQLPESILDGTFEKEQYGSYYRNLQGIVEHTHYHLGQITLLRKFLDEKNSLTSN